MLTYGARINDKVRHEGRFAKVRSKRSKIGRSSRLYLLQEQLRVPQQLVR